MLEQGRQAQAAQYWIDNVKSKLTVEKVAEIASGHAGEMDDGARKHHEVRRVHARGRLHQGHAGEAGRTCSSRGARTAGKLNASGQSPLAGDYAMDGRTAMNAASWPCTRCCRCKA